MVTADWTAQPLVACVDGPMVGQWYFQTDWDERVAAADYMAAKGERRQACLDYVVGSGMVEHPDQPAKGTPLRYKPKEATRG